MAKQKTAEQASGGGTAGQEAADQEITPASLPAPPKLRRRPLLVLGGLALIVTGALLGAWAWLAMSESSEVVAVRHTVMRGDTIGAEDLMTVQISPDPALQVVPGAELDAFVGQRAARDMSAGSLVTRESVTTEVVPGAGQSVVGLALAPALMPGEPLQVGDAVRVVGTAGLQGDPAALEPTTIFDAEVVDVTTAADANGTTVVSVLVAERDAATVARWAASGRVALVLDSREVG
ncbi:SAF domain-containing protein [Ornithinimicrobium cavernae]|uniref:SAF domain-containing protein n=1 Tax=Ornithinimicrobium cavernae TaxID=2666047 RepID=UPI001F44947C|nr:SAF domain-containing protein [Ornithinimicrobium cavernae]